jgi:histidinol phosphatase-like enzyme
VAPNLKIKCCKKLLLDYGAEKVFFILIVIDQSYRIILSYYYSRITTILTGLTLYLYCYECSCRKTKIGMLSRVYKLYNIDMQKSWMIGYKE